MQWTRKYLTDRSQVVVVGGEQSPAVPVTSGVPQGSVLGPLLFTIFINDVVHQVSPGSAMSLAIRRRHGPLHSTDDYHVLQHDITAIYIVEWIDKLLLSLQPAKCCFMLLSRKKRSDPPPPPNSDNWGHLIGLCFVCQVSWNPVNSRSVLVTSRVRHMQKGKASYWSALPPILQQHDTNTLLHLYKTFGEAPPRILLYGVGPHLHGDIEALEKVQRFGLRMCLRRWDADRHQVCELSQTPLLSNRRKVARLCHLYKMTNNLTDYPDPPLQPRVLCRNSRSSHGLQFTSFRAKTHSFQKLLASGTHYPMKQYHLHHSPFLNLIYWLTPEVLMFIYCLFVFLISLVACSYIISIC